MKTRIGWTFLFLVLTLPAWAQMQEKELKLAYIEQFKLLAVSEMERSGVPASIKLGQGLLESRWGTSDLASKANNHFGIKCGGIWDGPTYYKKDDDTDANGNLINSCFRSYASAMQCFMDHSNFLLDPRKVERYGFLFELPRTDYRSWAEGLKKAGYATDGTYHHKLIKIIEEFSLFQYDSLSTAQVMASMGTIPSGTLAMERPPIQLKNSSVFVFNDVEYVQSVSAQTIRDVATRHSISVKTLLHYNDNLYKADAPLPIGSRVFLQPKRKSFRGKTRFHLVKKGDNMGSISNLYAVSLDALYHRNRMTPGEEPLPDEKIKLRGGKSKTPKLDVPAKPPVLLQPTIFTPPVNTGGSILSNIPMGESTTSKPLPSKYNTEPTQPVNTSNSAIAQPITAPQYYLVLHEETLDSIAKKLNTNSDTLRKINNLAQDTAVRPGMRIRIR
jgi:LysM repeat protein